MNIVNTTFYVATTLRGVFFDWLKGSYIPSAPLANISVDHIRESIEEGYDGYAVRGECASLAEARAWHEGEGAMLRNALTGIYGEQILHFTTYMERVEL